MLIVRAFIAILMVLQALVLAGTCSLVIDHFQDNHTGLDIRLFYLLPIAAISLALSTNLRTRPLMKAAIAGSALFLLTIAVVDFGNIVVEYNEWCHRHMPSSALEKLLSRRSFQ